MENMLNSTQKSAASQSDSDSGDSLFVTQSVTSAKRTAKRHRSSERPRISQELDDEEASDKGDTRCVEDRQDAVPTRDSGSDSSDVDLSSLYQALSSRLQKGGRRPVTVAQRASFSFLESRSGRLSVSKNQILVNAEVGGFFKCMKKLSEGQEERNRPHLLWPPLLSDQLQEYNDDVDIQTVDMHCFIPVAHNKHKKAWLHTNMIPVPKDSSKKSKIRQKGKVKKDPKKSKNTPASKVAKDLTESEEDTHDDSSSSDIEKPQSDKVQSQKSITCHSPPLVSSSESSFIQSLLAEQEENSEKHLPVLATCTQSIGLHPGEELIQPSENMGSESDDETVIDETQWPGLTDHNCQDKSKDRRPTETELGLENLKGTGQTNSDISDTHYELEDEASGSNPSSQDLFEDLRNRTVERMVSTPLKEVRIGNCNESDLDTDKSETVDFITLRHISENVTESITGRCLTPQADQISEPQSTEVHRLQADIKENENVQSVLHLHDDTDIEEASECVLPSGENKQQQELVKDKNVSIESSQDESPRSVQGSAEQTQKVEVVPMEELEDTEDFEVCDETEALSEIVSKSSGHKEVQSTDPSSPRKKTVRRLDNVAEVHKVVCIDSLEYTDFSEEPKNQTDLKVEADTSEYSELQRFTSFDNLQSNEISPEAEEINQTKEESPKQTLNNDLPCNNPSQPSESKAHGSSPSKDDLLVGKVPDKETEAAESPLFNFGGINFLKRRKRKTTGESELRQDQQLLTLLKNKDKEDEEEQKPPLVKNKDLTNAFLSAWESEPQSDGVCDVKAKKKRKNDKQVRSANQLIEGTHSASVPESLEQLRRTEHSNPEFNRGGSQEGSSSESLREGSKDGIPSDGSGIRKKKKSKRKDLQNTEEPTYSNTETKDMENRKPDGQPSDYQSELNQGSCDVPTRLETQHGNGLALQADQVSDTQSIEVSKVKAKKCRKNERQIESMSLLTKEPGSEEDTQVLYPASEHLNSSAKPCKETGKESGPFKSSEPLKKNKKKAKKGVSYSDDLPWTELSDSACSITKTEAVGPIKQGVFAEYVDEEQHKEEIVLASSFPLENREEPLMVSMVVQPTDQVSKVKEKKRRKMERRIESMSLLTKEPGSEEGIQVLYPAIEHLNSSAKPCGETGGKFGSFDSSEPLKKNKKKAKKGVSCGDDLPWTELSDTVSSITKTEAVEPIKQGVFAEYVDEEQHKKEIVLASRFLLENHEEPLTVSMAVQPVDQNFDARLTEACEIKTKSKRKKDKHVHLMSKLSEETGPASERLEHISGASRNLNGKEVCTEAGRDIMQSDASEPRKKEKTKKRDLSDDVVSSQRAKESDPGHHTSEITTVKKKNKKKELLTEDFGRERHPAKNLEEPLMDNLKIPVGTVNQDSKAQSTGDCHRKAKKKRKKDKHGHDIAEIIDVNRKKQDVSTGDFAGQVTNTRHPSMSLKETSIDIQQVDQDYEVKAKKKKKKHKRIQSLIEGTSMETSIAFERLLSTTDQPEQFERTESGISVFREQDCHVEVHGESRKDLMPLEGSKPLKKKKRHLSDDMVTFQRAEESEPGGTTETLTVKKKRKKKELFTEDFGRERQPSKIFEEPLKDNHEIPLNQDSEAQLTKDCGRKIKKKRNKYKHVHGITETVQLATTGQPSRSLEDTSIEIQPVDQISVQLTPAKKKKKKDKHIQPVSKLSEGTSMEQDEQESSQALNRFPVTEEPEQFKKTDSRNHEVRKLDCDLEVHGESREGLILSEGSKPSKKKKRDLPDVVTLQNAEESEPVGTTEITVKKKKKPRHKENLEDTLKGSCDIPAPVEVLPLVCLQADDSFPSKKNKKKKKKRQEEVGDETKTTEHVGATESIQEIHVETGIDGLPCPNKKKKKKKQDTDDGSTLDSWVQLPSNVPSESMGPQSSVPVESVPGNKKKKKKR